MKLSLRKYSPYKLYENITENLEKLNELYINGQTH